MAAKKRSEIPAPETIVVRLKDTTCRAAVRTAIAERFGWREVSWNKVIAAMVVDVNKDDLEEAVARAKLLEGVEGAFPNAGGKRNPPVVKPRKGKRRGQ